MTQETTKVCAKLCFRAYLVKDGTPLTKLKRIANALQIDTHLSVLEAFFRKGWGIYPL